MGYTTQSPRPIWPQLSPLPREEYFYRDPDPTAWSDPHRRRAYRRYRINRHEEYMRCLSWRRSLLGADISRRLEAGRSAAESAWLLDEELTRGFSHRRPLYGLCECEHYYSDQQIYWWPFPEDEWAPPSGNRAQS